PEAVSELRRVRRRAPDGAFVSLSGADPLNLVGIVTPGAKLPALTGNRVLYRDGLPIATLSGGAVKLLVTLDPAGEWEAQKALLHGPTSVPPIAPEQIESVVAHSADS